MFGTLDISTSGLIAQRTRLEAVSANLANKDSIYDARGNYAPYRRRSVVLASDSNGGVKVAKIELDQSAFRKVRDPGNPNADKDGYVEYPNVDPAIEMINAVEASRSYEANITAAEATKSMFQSSLRLLA